MSDSYVINYNFLYRPFSIEIDATSFLSKEMLFNCTYTDTPICANGRRTDQDHGHPQPVSSLNTNFAPVDVGIDKKGTRCYFPRVGRKCVLLLILFETAEKFYKPL